EIGVARGAIRVAETFPGVARLRELGDVEPEHRDGTRAVLLFLKLRREGLERVFAEIVGAGERKLLTKLAVAVDRRGHAAPAVRLTDLLTESHRPRTAAVARVAPHVDPTVPARRDLLQVSVDVAEHPVHLPGAILVGILVRSEVVGLERLALLPDVAIAAADPESPREPLHDGLQLLGRKVLRKSLRVLHLIGPLPAFLSLRGDRQGQGERSQENR